MTSLSGKPWKTVWVLDEVSAERASQDQKWGEQNHPDGTGDDARLFDVPFADLAKIARSACDTADKIGCLTWAHILAEEFFEALAESDPVKLREELVQVAAVATAWIEAIDRRADN